MICRWIGGFSIDPGLGTWMGYRRRCQSQRCHDECIVLYQGLRACSDGRTRRHDIVDQNDVPSVQPVRSAYADVAVQSSHPASRSPGMDRLDRSRAEVQRRLRPCVDALPLQLTRDRIGETQGMHASTPHGRIRR